MPAIRPISWRKFDKFLKYVDCDFIRKEGAHRVYTRADLLRPIIVPEHQGDLPVFIIRANLRTLRIEPGQYLKILQKI